VVALRHEIGPRQVQSGCAGAGSISGTFCGERRHYRHRILRSLSNHDDIASPRVIGLSRLEQQLTERDDDREVILQSMD
jgi:hypothetical protein